VAIKRGLKIKVTNLKKEIVGGGIKKKRSESSGSLPKKFGKDRRAEEERLKGIP